MLVLSRKTDETIVFSLADGTKLITITVNEIRGRDGRVRLGVEALPDIIVLRGELIGTEDGRRHERNQTEDTRNDIRD